MSEEFTYFYNLFQYLKDNIKPSSISRNCDIEKEILKISFSIAAVKFNVRNGFHLDVIYDHNPKLYIKLMQILKKFDPKLKYNFLREEGITITTKDIPGYMKKDIYKYLGDILGFNYNIDLDEFYESEITIVDASLHYKVRSILCPDLYSLFYSEIIDYKHYKENKIIMDKQFKDQYEMFNSFANKLGLKVEQSIELEEPPPGLDFANQYLLVGDKKLSDKQSLNEFTSFFNIYGLKRFGNIFINLLKKEPKIRQFNEYKIFKVLVRKAVFDFKVKLLNKYDSKLDSELIKNLAYLSDDYSIKNLLRSHEKIIDPQDFREVFMKEFRYPVDSFAEDQGEWRVNEYNTHENKLLDKSDIYKSFVSDYLLNPYKFTEIFYSKIDKHEFNEGTWEFYASTIDGYYVHMIAKSDTTGFDCEGSGTITYSTSKDYMDKMLN